MPLGWRLPRRCAARQREAFGDSLDDFGDFDADPTLAQLQAFVGRSRTSKAASLLKSATTRFVYDLDRYQRCGEPPFAATLVRETHVSDLLSPQDLKIQTQLRLLRRLRARTAIEDPRRAGPGAAADARHRRCRAAMSRPAPAARRATALPVSGPSDTPLGRQGPHRLQQQGQTGQAIRALLQQHASVRTRAGDDRYRRHADSVLRSRRARRRHAASQPHLRESRVRSLAAGNLGRQRHRHPARPEDRSRRRRLLPERCRTPTTCPPGTTSAATANWARTRRTPPTKPRPMPARRLWPTSTRWAAPS